MGTTGGKRTKVVIVGGGFGGLTAARAFADAPVDVTIVDKTNHHLFQPLLYQVAMAGLSPADIAQPIRSMVHDERNVKVVLDEVRSVDVAHKRLHTAEGFIDYDDLILSAGAQNNYFGHPEWERHALGLKTLDDAVEIRRRVLLAFEAAEKEPDPQRRKQLLTFVSIGGGPTGVELAGSIAELSHFVLEQDFRNIDPHQARVVLLEAGPRIVPSFSEDLSEKAVVQLKQLRVEVRTGAMVTNIDASGVYLGNELIPSATVVWAAGVAGSPLGQTLGVPLDRAGRVIVEPDCSIPGHKEVFVIGDMAAFLHDGGKPLPGVSPVAMQQARFVAKAIEADLHHAPRGRFEYVDKGSMSTIGRSRAIAQMGRIKLSGFIAWMAWLVVHIWYLIGFRNRLVVMITWAWSYWTYKRGARLITGNRMEPGAPIIGEARLLPPPVERPVDNPQEAPRSTGATV